MTRIRSRSAFIATLPILVALAAPAQAQTAAGTAPLEKSPFYSGAQIARAIREGRIQPGMAPLRSPIGIAPLKCSPTPCALPNVEVAGGNQPVVDTPIAAVEVGSQKHDITARYDLNCIPSLMADSVTNDGGSTWKSSCMTITKASDAGNADPIVGYDLLGNVYAGGLGTDFNTNKHFIALGVTHQGKSFTGTVTLVRRVAKTGGKVDVENPWLAVDVSPKSPHANAVYISSTQAVLKKGNSVVKQIVVSHSTDQGKTWATVAVGPAVTSPEDITFSNLAIGADGSVYATAMFCVANGPTSDCGGTTATMYFSKSTDGGNTWTSPAAIGTAALAPDACDCAFYGSLPNTSEPMTDIPAIAIDNSGGKSNGTLYVVDYNWTGSFMQVQVVSSTDGGTSWGTPVPVASKTDVHDQFMPWINVSSNGLIGVSWLDRGNDPNNIDYEAYGAVSSDGVNYPNLQLAAAPSNPFHDGFGGSYLGEYTGNAWNGNTLYVTWPDTSNGVAAQAFIGGEIP